MSLWAPFFLPPSPSLGLCLFLSWTDCVRSSAGSSGSLRPLACEHVCDLYSELLPGSDHDTHAHTDMHTRAEQTEEKVSVQYINGITDMIKLVKDSMKSVNCNLSICSISLAAHASVELGGNYTTEHLTLRKSQIPILIIIIVVCEQMSASWTRGISRPSS